MKHHDQEVPSALAFIGPPTAGKTNIGKRVVEILNLQLAKRQRWAFADTDDRIVEHCGADKLQTVMDSMSQEKFARLEKKIVIKTMKHISVPTVVATGGSVVYYPAAMKAIQKRAHIIFLTAPFEVIMGRIANRKARVIVYKPNQTKREWFDERMSLYASWAHETIDASNREERAAIAQAIAESILNREIC